MSCDDFFVDELLDLTNEDGFVKEEEEEKDKSFVSDHENSNTRTITFSASKDEFGSVPISELGRDKGDSGEVRVETKRELGESESESIAKREKKLIKYLMDMLQ